MNHWIRLIIIIILVILIILFNYSNVSNISNVFVDMKYITSTTTIRRNIDATRNYGIMVSNNSKVCQVKKFQYSVDVRRYHRNLSLLSLSLSSLSSSLIISKIPIMNKFYYELSDYCLLNQNSSINNFNNNDNDTNCVTDYSVNIYYVNDNRCEVIVRRLDELRWKIPFHIVITSYRKGSNIDHYKYDEILVVPPSNSSCMQILYQTNITLHKDLTIYKKQRIPKNIIQTYHSFKPQNEYHANAYKTFEEKNPEYKMYFFLDEECRKLIKQYFSARVLAAYDVLVPKAFRADLFRYCALYILGGCYVDHKIIGRKSFRSIMKDDDDLLVTYDNGDFFGIKLKLFNGFMCSKQGDSRFKKLIDDVVYNIEQQSYGYYFMSHADLSITGPVAMRLSLRNHLNDTVVRFYHQLFKAPNNSYGHRRTRYMDSYFLLNPTIDINTDIGGEGLGYIVATKSYRNYYGSSRESYHELWVNHKLYYDASLSWQHYKFQYVSKSLHEIVGHNARIDIDCGGRLMLVIRRPTLKDSIYNLYTSIMSQKYNISDPHFYTRRNMTIKQINEDTNQEQFINFDLLKYRRKEYKQYECQIYMIQTSLNSTSSNHCHEVKNHCNWT